MSFDFQYIPKPCKCHTGFRDVETSKIYDIVTVDFLDCIVHPIVQRPLPGMKPAYSVLQREQG